MKQKPGMFTIGKWRGGFVLLATLTFWVATWGADAKAEGKATKEDLATLQQFLKMPKDDLARMRLTLEAIEKMSPEERRKTLSHIQNLNKIPTEQRKETIDRWNELSPEMKKAYFDYLRKLSSSNRKKFKEQPWDKQIAEVKKNGKK